MEFSLFSEASKDVQILSKVESEMKIKSENNFIAILLQFTLIFIFISTFKARAENIKIKIMKHEGDDEHNMNSNNKKKLNYSQFSLSEVKKRDVQCRLSRAREANGYCHSCIMLLS